MKHFLPRTVVILGLVSFLTGTLGAEPTIASLI